MNFFIFIIVYEVIATHFVSKYTATTKMSSPQPQLQWQKGRKRNVFELWRRVNEGKKYGYLYKLKHKMNTFHIAEIFTQ